MIINKEKKTRTESYTQYDCLCDFCGKLFKRVLTKPHKLRTLCPKCDEIFYTNYVTGEKRKRCKKILEQIQYYLYDEKAAFEIKQLFEEDEK